MTRPVPIVALGPARGASRAALVFAGFLLLGAAGAALAAPTDQDCLACHAGGLGRGSAHVDVAALRASPHAALTCNSCHPDARSIPHPPKLGAVRCGGCHGAVADTVSRSVHGGGGHAAGCAGCHGTHDVKSARRMDLGACVTCHPRETTDYRASVHGEALANGDNEASTCRDCHGRAHTVASHADPAAPTNRKNLAGTCARCHADRQLVTRRRISIPEAYALYERSVHGRSDSTKAAVCNDCHESHRLRRASDPQSSIHPAHLAATCGRCHAREAREYRESVHGEAVARGVSAAPTCTGCHGEHRIRGPREPGSPVSQAAVTTTCAHCHEAAGIRETYGLPAGRLDTYRDSFHGLAARGGSPAVANCASCHGTHDILPSSNPRSTVSSQRLPETCGRCHPGAGERFASGPVHVVAATADNRTLFLVRWIYLVLIVGTIGGMVAHNGLDFARKIGIHWLRNRPSPRLQDPEEEKVGHAPTGGRRWFVRMNGFQRLQHFLLLISFFTLVATGFALKFPESWLFSWLARLEQGYAWRSLVHRGAAIVMVGVAAMHLVELGTRRGRKMIRHLLPGPGDARDVVGNLLYLTGLRKHPPAFDRFSYVEKAEYWALVWGTAVMTITGVVLWFENHSLRWLSKWMLDVATLVHYYEAWLAFLAILVWHVYQNVLNPDVYPMNWTWLTGRLSERQLRHEHGGVWKRFAVRDRARELPPAS